jgi:hypothetical protein
MGMIDRYKKRGGFIQLLQLMETMGAVKREQFLKAIADESPTWEAAIKKRMLSIERMLTWNGSFLMEFVPQVPHMAIACAIHPLPPEKRSIFLSALAFGDRRKVEEILNSHVPNAGEIISSQMKMISEVRHMVSIGKMKFEKFDPELVIDEDIEEKLKSGSFIELVDDHVAEMEAAGNIPAGVSAASKEELTALRRKIVALTQENSHLLRENKEMKDRLEAIKMAVQKIA